MLRVLLVLVLTVQMYSLDELHPSLDVRIQINDFFGHQCSLKAMVNFTPHFLYFTPCLTPQSPVYQAFISHYVYHHPHFNIIHFKHLLYTHQSSDHQYIITFKETYHNNQIIKGYVLTLKFDSKKYKLQDEEEESEKSFDDQLRQEKYQQFVELFEMLQDVEPQSEQDYKKDIQDNYQKYKQIMLREKCQEEQQEIKQEL